MRGAWIEILEWDMMIELCESLPMRGAWIEISGGALIWASYRVAPHAGSVD